MKAILALSGLVIKELYRRKDFYVLFVMTAVITLVMASANIFQDDKIVGYLKEICLRLIWLSALVIAVGTAARQIPAELEQRTIFPLLAKPVTRWHVVAGKFLGCWLASGISLLVFYFFLMVVSASHEHEWRAENYLQAMWMQWIFLAVVIAMVLCGSVVFAAPSSNVTISLVVISGILLLGQSLNLVAVHQAEPVRSALFFVYFTIPQLGFFYIGDFVIHKMGIVEWKYIFLATLYGAAYAALFLFSCWLFFRRKTLSR